MKITPDPDALYASYASLLYGYLLQQIPDREIAHRVFVETFKYAFSHSQEYQKENSRYYSWLLRIARKQIDEQGIELSPGEFLVLHVTAAPIS